MKLAFHGAGADDEVVEPHEAESSARLHGEYLAERERLVRRRLPFAARFFLMSIGASAVVEAALEPGRTVLLLGVFLSQLVCCVGATVLVRPGRPALRPSHAAALVSIVVVAIAIFYLARVGATPARIGLTTVCLLAGASLLLPWGGGVQAAVSVAIAIVLIGAVPGVLDPEQLGAVWLPVVVVGALAYAGARHVDRYREDAFVRAAREAEEGRTTAALVRIGETLHRHLREPDLLDRVCHVARQEVRCDWTALYLLDDAIDGHRLRGFSGPPGADSRETLAEYVASDETLPLLRELPTTDVIEIRDARRQTLIPAALVERFHIGAALYTPIQRDGRVIGAIAHGFFSPRREFAASQRRLVVGIAHVTAVAVENLRLIDQLAAASRLKSEFVATMSHELRTPLSVISGYADLLDEGAFGPVTAEQHDTLARIRQSSMALLELVNMTLDLGRLEAGREEVVPTVFAVHELVQEVQGEQSSLVPAGVRHAWEYEYDLAVRTDRAKVKTIFKNLVGNALKFTSAGRVDVHVLWHDGELRLDVADTGVGIGAEHLPVIFEMFRQVDASASRRYEGVGLGLHIVQRLTVLLGGTVSVESQLGQGSTFRVRIPCERATVGARRSA